MKLDVRPWRDIDADYLNAILVMNEVDATIASFRASPVGTGQVGDCIRFELEYPSSAPRAPTSMVGKFPADDPTSRGFGIKFGIYEREVNFYKLLQPKAQITTPSCFFADIDEDTSEFVLLMSDEAPAAQGDQLQGITLSQAREVARQAARLHSAFWLDEDVLGLDWLAPTPEALAAFDPAAMQAAWAAFRDRYGALVSDKAAQVGEALVGKFEQYREMREDNFCLVHADFRPDNMLFATSAGGKPLSVVDWQSVGPGPAATDLGYCFAGALEPDLRRQHEAELIDLYSQELARLGVNRYEAEKLKQHYVLGAYQHFATAFHSSVMVERTERGDAMFFKMIKGAVDLILDYDAQDWFS